MQNGDGSSLQHSVRTKDRIDDPPNGLRGMTVIGVIDGLHAPTELGYFEGRELMGGPRDGTHSRYLGPRFSGLRCASVQNSRCRVDDVSERGRPHSGQVPQRSEITSYLTRGSLILNAAPP